MAGLPVIELLHREQVSLIVISAGFGAILVDWLQCLPAEIKYIYQPDIMQVRKGRLPSLPSILLLIPRLATIPIIAMSYSIFVGMSDDCHLKWKVLLSLYTVSTINSFSIFCVRLIAIRNSKRPMIIFLVFLIVAHTIVMFYWLFQAEITPPLMITSTQSVCSGLRLVSWTYQVFFAFGSLDVLILLLTLYDRDWQSTKIRLQTTWKVWKSDSSTVTQSFYSHTILYYTLQIIFMYSEAIWVYHYSEDQILGVLTAPLHLLLVLSVSTRVIRSLKLYSAKKDRFGLTSTNATSTASSQQRFYDISGKNHVSKGKLRLGDEELAFDQTQDTINLQSRSNERHPT